MTDARNARTSTRVAWAAFPPNQVIAFRYAFRVAVDTAVTTPSVQTYDGSNFVRHPVAVWDGVRWVAPSAVKTWNGSTFT